MTNFALYRKGVVAFNLECRRSGEVRKASSCVFKEEIMTDDSVSVTLKSTVLLDFELRDYIIYDGRPYFLNRMPECSIDEHGIYTYKLVFEGAMYELGRVAFILDNAYGYDYYGQLYDFGKLIVDNMNRINRHIEWDYTQNGVTTRHSARLLRTIGNITYWAKNRPVDTQTWNGSFTHWIATSSPEPRVGDYALDINRTAKTDCVIVGVKEWTLDFPKGTSTPPTYPQPGGHCPDDEYAVRWPDHDNSDDQSYITEQDCQAIANTYQQEDEYSGWIDTPSYEDPDDGGWTVLTTTTVGRVSKHTPIPEPNGVPKYPGQTCVLKNDFSFLLTTKIFHRSFDGGTHQWGDWYLYDDTKKMITLKYTITYRAIGYLTYTWQIEQPTQGTGQVTQNHVVTDNILLSYDSHSCLGVLQDICSKWAGWEWYIDNVEHDFCDGEALVTGVIHILPKNRNNTGVIHNMNFGRSGGLSMIKCKYADESNIPSRVYFYGGTKNVGGHYRNSRICLPGFSKEDSWIEFRSFTGAMFPLGVSNTTCEEVKVFDDIYPANNPFKLSYDGVIAKRTSAISGNVMTFLELLIPKSSFFDINAIWSMNGQSSFPDRELTDNDKRTYPDYFEWMEYEDVKDTYDVDEHLWTQRDRYIEYFLGKDKYKTGDVYFTFQSGELAGYSFKFYNLEDHPEYRNIYVVMLHGIIDNGSNDDSVIPNQQLIARTGDTFIIEGITMPVTYTYYQGGGSGDYSAENQLWMAACDYMKSTSEKIDYEIDVAKDYVIKKEKVFRARDTVYFGDIRNGNSTVNKRISSVELDLVDGCKYKLIITDRGMVRPWIQLGTIIGVGTQQTER